MLSLEVRRCGVHLELNHTNGVSNMFNTFHGVAYSRVERIFTVEPRGLMQ